MKVVCCADEHVEQWLELRCDLWPHLSHAAHAAELAALRQRSYAGFLALSSDQDVLGFAEVSLRRDYVNGCISSPVGFLEGIYVRPLARRKGVARSLCRAAEAWVRSQGCSEFASDADIGNEVSHKMHRSLGSGKPSAWCSFERPSIPTNETRLP